MLSPLPVSLFFFFNDPATTEIYTLSLHDALPICRATPTRVANVAAEAGAASSERSRLRIDRKSTRLNSSHTVISYAVFCLKKKKRKPRHRQPRDARERGTDAHSRHDDDRELRPHM